jgi:hypothetical protein
VGALGVDTAHSGTVMGVLFGDHPSLVRRAAARAGAIPGLRRASVHRLVGGGGIVRGGADPVPREGSHCVADGPPTVRTTHSWARAGD